MKDATDILWGIYEQNLIYCRHHENQRASVTRFIITVTAVVIGLITFDKELSLLDVPLGLFVIGLGVFGVFFTKKQYERFSHHYERSRKIRDKLQEIIENMDISTLNREADSNNIKYFPWLSKRSLRWFWESLHILIVILGISLVIGAII